MPSETKEMLWLAKSVIDDLVTQHRRAEHSYETITEHTEAIAQYLPEEHKGNRFLNTAGSDTTILEFVALVCKDEVARRLGSIPPSGGTR